MPDKLYHKLRKLSRERESAYCKDVQSIYDLKQVILNLISRLLVAVDA